MGAPPINPEIALQPRPLNSFNSAKAHLSLAPIHPHTLKEKKKNQTLLLLIHCSPTQQKTKKRKNKNGIMNMGEERISALSVRLFLKEFCVEFLNGAYNPVMRYARSCIVSDAGAVTDSSHYLWSLRFFMNFNRHYNFRVKYVR